MANKEFYPKFRSNYNLGDYHDEERDFPPSVVDSTGYEELSVMVGKFLRGEIVKNVSTPVYTVATDADPEQAIAEMDVTRQSGFDLADAVILKQEAVEAVTALSKSKAKAKSVASKAPIEEGATGGAVSAPSGTNASDVEAFKSV